MNELSDANTNARFHAAGIDFHTYCIARASRREDFIGAMQNIYHGFALHYHTVMYTRAMHDPTVFSFKTDTKPEVLGVN